MAMDTSKMNVNGTIKVYGKEYPCRVLMGAMLRFKRKTGYDVSKMSMSDLSDLITFLWCCVAGSCNADNVPFDMDLEKFADGIDLESLTGFYEEEQQTEEEGEQKKSKKQSLK